MPPTHDSRICVCGFDDSYYNFTMNSAENKFAVGIISSKIKHVTLKIQISCRISFNARIDKNPPIHIEVPSFYFNYCILNLCSLIMSKHDVLNNKNVRVFWICS